MKIRNVLITGASGKVGRNVIPELVAVGYQVRAVRFEEPVECGGVEVVDGDVRDPGFAKRALQDMDAVIHLANCKERREVFMDTNIKGTFYLLDEATNCGHVKQFIQAGSDARAGIFYYPHPFPIDEAYPHSAYPGYYAFSKVLEEVMCEQYMIQYRLPITILRFSWVHDEDDFLCHITLKGPDFGVPVWSELAKSAEQRSYFKDNADGVAKLVHPGGKPGIRHIVGIRDVVSSILLALGNAGAIGHAFTIAGPSPFSYGYAADYVSERLSLSVVEFEHASFHDFAHNISKARSLLGYNPQWDITKIIDSAIEFRKSGKTRTPTKYVG